MMFVFSHTLHTHMQDYTHLRNTQTYNNEGVDILSITLFTDCLKTLISYLNPQHYACVDEYSNCSVECMPYYTHHKHKGAQHNDAMCYQIPLFTECLLHSSMGAHHGVCVCGISDHPCPCMFYYTHYKHKGALHCVRVDVLSDGSFY